MLLFAIFTIEDNEEKQIITPRLDPGTAKTFWLGKLKFGQLQWGLSFVWVRFNSSKTETVSPRVCAVQWQWIGLDGVHSEGF